MPGQTPAFEPASQAAPSAVVSRIFGRSTGASSMSARNCSAQSEAVIPPSTLSTVSASPSGQSRRIASSRSRVW